MKKEGKKTLTADLRQIDVVVMAVHLLGGQQRAIDTEDIAVRSHELAPGMFAWRKYPQQINLELVRVVLSNAKKTQYGTLLHGSGRDGWRLTALGLDWVDKTGQRLLADGMTWDQTRRHAGSVDARRSDREAARIRNSSAWKSWVDDGYVSVADARSLFRIDSYSNVGMAETKMVRLLSLFEGEDDVANFLRIAAKLVEETFEENK